MKFGNLFTQQTPDMAYSHADRLRETIELTQLAEELRFDSVSFAENHFSNYGYSPNPVLLAAAIGQHTDRIRLGSAVAVLPFWNPVRLAEDVATADLLLGGRFELGIGRGYQHIEFDGFGLPYDERQDVYAEAMEILLGAWTSDSFSYKGKYFEVPGEINILPKPLTRPHPQIMIGVASEGSVRAAAATEFRVFGTSLSKVKKPVADAQAEKSGVAQTADEFFGEATSHHEIYLAERRRLGLTGDHWVNGMNRQVYVTGARPGTKEYDDERHDALLRSQLLTRMGYGLRTKIVGYERGKVVPKAQPGDPSLESYLEHLVFGTPDEVTAQFRELRDDAGVQEVNLMIDYAGIPFVKARECMRLIGAEVIPALRADEQSS